MLTKSVFRGFGIAFFVLIVFVLVVSYHHKNIEYKKSQIVGFPNENIYYNMSINSLKKIFGEPLNEYNTEIEQCYKYEVELNKINGECTFKFYKNKLKDVIFISKKDGYDKSNVKEIFNSIKKCHEDEDNFKNIINEQDQAIYSESFELKDKNGATGKFVSIELNNMGKITIISTNLC